MIKLVDLFKLTALTQSQIDSLGGTYTGGELLFNSTSGLPMFYNGTVWKPLGGIDPLQDKVFSSLSGFIADAVPNNTVVATQQMDIATLFKINLNSSVVKCLTAPTAAVDVEIGKVSSAGVVSPIGNINFLANANNATFTFTADVTIAVGEGIRLTTPIDVHGMMKMFFNLQGESLLPMV